MEAITMTNNFITSENAGVVMAWCAVGTLAIGLGMTIYQIVQQQRQQEALEKAQEAMKGIEMSEDQQPDPVAA